MDASERKSFLLSNPVKSRKELDANHSVAVHFQLVDPLTIERGVWVHRRGKMVGSRCVNAAALTEC